MRDIKFIGWDKKTKKMRAVNNIAFHFEHESFDFNSSRLPKMINLWGYDIIEQKDIILLREANEVELLQYTESKDKASNDIWEGDIIRFWYWSRYEQRSFPEYIDFIETDLKEGRGIVYWNKSELSWYIKPDEDTMVYNSSEQQVKLDDMPLVYAGVDIQAIYEWLGGFDGGNQEYLKFKDCHGIERIGNIHQHPNLLNNGQVPAGRP